MAVHARTLEIYSKLDVANQAVALGTVGGGVNAWAEGEHKARIPFNEMGKEVSPFPYVLMLGQDENERILGAHLEQFGIAIQWSTELASLEQQPSRVVATLKRPDGSFAKVEAQYVAGCDGGRSTVREINRIGFPGAPYGGLRRGHGRDGLDASCGAQRLSLAQRLPSLLPDARH